MFSRLRLSTRIHLAVALPAIALFVVTAGHLDGKRRQVEELGRVRAMADLAQVGGALIHRLAVERGTTATFLGSRGRQFRTEMETARRNTDLALNTWSHFVRGSQDRGIDDGLRQDIEKAMGALGRIDEQRHRASTQVVDLQAPSAYYTDTNALLLRALMRFGRVSTDVDLATLVSAYVGLIQAKESLGQHRAAGALGFSAGTFDSALLQRFLTTVGAQNAYLAQFSEYAPPDMAEHLRSLRASPAMLEVERLRAEVARTGPGRPVAGPGGADWFNTVTQLIDNLDAIAHTVEERIVTTSEQAYRDALAELRLTAALTVLFLASILGIGYGIARGIRDTLTASSQALQSLAQGNTRVEFRAVDFPGETQPIYHALVTFRESLIGTQRLTDELTQARDELSLINSRLEQRVSERTAELRLAASVFENTAEGIMVTDTQGTIISVNPAFSSITGYRADEVMGRTPRLLKSDHHPAEFYATMWDDLHAKGYWEGQVWNRRKDGEAFLEWQTISVVPDQAGKPLRYVAVFNDVTELHHKDERLRHQAYHDALTGLPNRSLLQDRLGHAMDLAARDGGAVAAMVLDLDNFKLVNDSLGHDVGDQLLQEIARRLVACLRQSDTVARTGGDEFVVILADFTDAAEIAHTAERINLALAQPLRLAGQEIHTGGSVGIALYPQDAQDPSTLVKHADMAMYQAKADGRGTYRFFDPEMNRRSATRMAMETALRRSLQAGDGFHLAFQPKIDLQSGRTLGLEALVRWTHPELGPLSPAEFIPIAEDSGLIVALGNWVISASCRQMRLWREAGYAVPDVAINLSPRQFGDAQLVDTIHRHLDEAGIPASSLELEVTESTVMSDPEKAIATLERIHALGAHIAVDDFGTGYSSLSYLKRLPLDTLKIDRSFVRDLCTDAEDAAIARTIVALGQTLGLEIVAEGIETDAQRDMLLAMGCTVGQGYLFARPQSPEEAARFLAAA
ncbi:MAG: EAL domain-containing protein [Azonexus sp.]|nr:EAL domain-containing protein [Betaproteobacteria bacterium]MBK8917936.1 EAL domain-containing protein [Betaproteobacteria bacterium]MBP6036434.1 EAL domain-containing protein [Azonexus sp.]MBP6907043.1 EAL domain-containing protein [Azonexus sp.]